jgi:Holliday junction DNA helicase RuvB
LDRAVLEALITKFGGGPVGLSTLAIAVGEETETVETVAEPYLVREGLLGRTPRGRIALAPAWTHLGFAIPAGAFGQDPLELFQADELGESPMGASGGDPGEETDPQWIRNSR